MRKAKFHLKEKKIININERKRRKSLLSTFPYNRLIINAAFKGRRRKENFKERKKCALKMNENVGWKKSIQLLLLDKILIY